MPRLAFSPPEVVCSRVGGQQLLSQELKVLLAPHLQSKGARVLGRGRGRHVQSPPTPEHCSPMSSESCSSHLLQQH